MTARLRCFAGLRDDLGSDIVEIEVPEGATVADLKRLLEARWPRLSGRLGSVRIAADFEFLDESATLPAGAELALIPPVSGGAPGADSESRAARPDVVVRLSAEPLDPARALDAVRGADAGALVTFHGTVRAGSRGKVVTALEYEAYEPMALAWLERLARAARRDHGALRVAVWHRTGRVPVGGDSVVIAVAAAHRAEAFAAGRHVIEGLKADVPIWKREFYDDGDVWVGWGS
jgi:molybdopterin synthase catalytic subunit/molybdopterin converting factor small subunit